MIAQQKGWGGEETTTAANLAVLLARRDRRVLAVDTDTQFALTRQLGLEIRSLGVNLVDVLAGRAAAGIVELRQTSARLSERLGAPAPGLAVLLTRWQRHRISSREMEEALIAEALAPSAGSRRAPR